MTSLLSLHKILGEYSEVPPRIAELLEEVGSWSTLRRTNIQELEVLLEGFIPEGEDLERVRGVIQGLKVSLRGIHEMSIGRQNVGNEIAFPCNFCGLEARNRTSDKVCPDCPRDPADGNRCWVCGLQEGLREHDGCAVCALCFSDYGGTNVCKYCQSPFEVLGKGNLFCVSCDQLRCDIELHARYNRVRIHESEVNTRYRKSIESRLLAHPAVRPGTIEIKVKYFEEDEDERYGDYGSYVTRAVKIFPFCRKMYLPKECYDTGTHIEYRSVKILPSSWEPSLHPYLSKRVRGKVRAVTLALTDRLPPGPLLSLLGALTKRL